MLIKRGDIKGLLKHFVTTNPYTCLLFKFQAFYIVTLSIIYKLYNHGGVSTAILFSIIAAILFFVVTLRWFLFIGEAERYVVYLAPFIILSIHELGHFSLTGTLALTCFLAIFCVFFAHLLSIDKSAKNESREKEVRDVISDLNDIPDKLNIVTIPFTTSGGWRILSDTKHNWLYGLGLWKNEEDIKNFNSYIKRYPVLDLDLAEDISNEYSIDVFIISKDILSQKDKEGGSPLAISGFEQKNKNSICLFVRKDIEKYFANTTG